MIVRVTAGFLLVLASTLSAPAAVQDVASNGFTIVETAGIAASPKQVYAALVAPARWWSSEHTYSQNAANLSLDARAGGCWCEALPGGGSVLHLVVVNAMPGMLLRLRGALGPLQGMAVDGAMTFTVRAAGKNTQLTLMYVVGGYAKQGFGELATAVDSVLAEQTVRLKRLIETGSAEITSQSKKEGE